jgi:hypothetical protein
VAAAPVAAVPAVVVRTTVARATVALASLALATLAALLPSCRTRSGDPALLGLARSLAPQDRILALRDLDPPAGTSLAAIVAAADGRPELRIYHADHPGSYSVAHKTRQGDLFDDLVLADVNGDGPEEIVVTWRGGHLEMIEVIAREKDGAFKTIFQNAGSSIERRAATDGTSEFWITSRTYEEQPGQPPTYDTTVHRWQAGAFAEVSK